MDGCELTLRGEKRLVDFRFKGRRIIVENRCASDF